MGFDFGRDDRSFLDNYDDVQAALPLEQLPPGVYETTLTKWSGDKSNKKQTPFILLTFAVLDGEYRGQKIFYRLYWTKDSAQYSRRMCEDSRRMCEVLGIDPRKNPEDYGEIRCSVSVFLKDDKYLEVRKIANARHFEKSSGGSPFDV